MFKVISLMFSAYVIYNESERVLKWWLYSLISKSMIEACQPSEPYIDRKKLTTNLAKEIYAYNSDDTRSNLRTILVCGPRGAGKTTIVSELLKETKGIVRIPISKMGTLDDVFEQLLDGLGMKRLPVGTTRRMMIESVLKQISEERKTKTKDKDKIWPTLLFEVNSQCSSKELQDLLVLLKEWGGDNEWAKSIVVVSAVRAAMSLNIGLRPLRVVLVHVPGLTLEEVEQFVDAMLTDVCRDTTERARVANFVSPKLGRLLNNLHELKRRVQRCNSLHEAEEAIEY